MGFGGLSFHIAGFPPAARERGIILRPYSGGGKDSSSLARLWTNCLSFVLWERKTFIWRLRRRHYSNRIALQEDLRLF